MVNTVSFRQDSGNISVQSAQQMSIISDDKKLQQLNRLANLTNKELKDIATLQIKKEKNEKFNKRLSIILALPILDGILTTALTRGKLSKKLSAGLLQGGSFAAVIALFAPYNMIFDKITKKSDTLKNYAQNHHFMTLLVNLFGFLLMLSTVKFLGYKLKDFIVNKKLNLVEKLTNKSSKFAEKINKSFLNDKIYKPISKFSQNFASKFPTITGFSRLAALFAVPFLLIAVVLKAINDRNELTHKQKTNYSNLKAQRDLAKASLDLINNSL